MELWVEGGGVLYVFELYYVPPRPPALDHSKAEEPAPKRKSQDSKWSIMDILKSKLAQQLSTGQSAFSRQTHL